MSQGLRTYDSKGRLTLDSVNYTWNLLTRILLDPVESYVVRLLLAEVTPWRTQVLANSGAPGDTTAMRSVLTAMKNQLPGTSPLKEELQGAFDSWISAAEALAEGFYNLFLAREGAFGYALAEQQLPERMAAESAAYATLYDSTSDVAVALPGGSGSILMPAAFTQLKVVRTHVGSPMNVKTVLASVEVRNDSQVFFTSGSVATLITVLVR